MFSMFRVAVGLAAVAAISLAAGTARATTILQLKVAGGLSTAMVTTTPGNLGTCNGAYATSGGSNNLSISGSDLLYYC